MIRRKNMTIFTDAKDNTTVLELKKIIEGEEFIIYIYLTSDNNIMTFHKRRFSYSSFFLYPNFYEMYEHLSILN